jgi:hypothetical protein
MDPNDCWASIISAITTLDRDEVDRDRLVEDLRNLADWIEKGGALPNIFQ